MDKQNKDIPAVRESMIFIPDIIGYTRFVHGTDIKFGKEIIFKLLSEILQANLLDLKISEIEGDAVLFYRNGEPPHLKELFAQYEAMLIGFKKKLRDMDEQYHLKEFELSLKLIVHFGPVEEYDLYGFHKLYGEAINEAHVLLKNEIPGHNYVLITQNVLDKIAGWEGECTMLPEWINEEVRTFVNIGHGKLHFSYFLYDAATLKAYVLRNE